VHTLSHSFAQMLQCTSMMFRGVFDRFPKLRVAFMEAGCSWAPYWFGRMNEEWEKRGEVEARAFSLISITAQRGDWLRDKKINILAQVGDEPVQQPRPDAPPRGYYLNIVV
jgi:predicted TIM-barrel fold metal-dependent hydrolase